MRLNKYIAHAGVCSRRKAADLVKNGNIKVNDRIEKNPAYEVKEKDKVFYKNQLLKPSKGMVYILLNKPTNTITTLKDERNRKTVMDLIEGMTESRVFPVGRLDRNTTGLLLLTNDGDLAKKLSHPSHEITKYYHVVLDKPLDKEDLKKIKKGLPLKDGIASVDGIEYVKGSSSNNIGVKIHIGRNRIVRRIFEHLDYSVKRLDRTYFAGLTKKDLPKGRARFLTNQEIIMLKHFV